MTYLFARQIDHAIARGTKPEETSRIKTKCEKTTKELLRSHPLAGNIYPSPDPASENVAKKMGSKSKRDRDNTPAAFPHASDPGYVGDEWRLVSDNAKLIEDKVSSELQHAYDLGLDTRSPVVVGKMYKLAVLVWSGIGDYTGHQGNEGRR